MKTTFTLAFALFIFFNTVAQQTFQKVINTGATSNSLPPSIKPTLDGGFIYSWSYSRLLTDNTTVHETSFGKFKRAGEVQWTRLLPGMDEPVAIQLEDSSFILSSSSYEIQIIKTDKAGNTIWRKSYTHNLERPACTIRASNGFLYVLYSSYFGVGIVKINAQTGATVLERVYGQTALEAGWNGTCMYETSDRGFIICGYGINTGYNTYLLKTDSLLNQQWCKIYYKKQADSSHRITTAYSVIESLDKGYVISGWSRAPRNSNDQKADVLKVDNIGNPVWHKQYGSDSSNYIEDITKNTDSTFTFIGSSGSCRYPCYYRGTITRIRANGTIIWSRVATETNLLYGIIKSISKTFTTIGYAGIAPGGLHVLRFTSDGQSCAGIKNNKFTTINIVDSVVNNTFMVTIPFKRSAITLDPGINTIASPEIFTNCSTSVANSAVENSDIKVDDDFSAVIYPNPVAGKSTQLKINASRTQRIQLAVFNAEGKTIIQRNMLLNIGSNAINLDISMLHVGVYFVKLDAIKYRKVIQFIKTE